MSCQVSGGWHTDLRIGQEIAKLSYRHKVRRAMVTDWELCSYIQVSGPYTYINIETH